MKNQSWCFRVLFFVVIQGHVYGMDGDNLMQCLNQGIQPPPPTSYEANQNLEELPLITNVQQLLNQPTTANTATETSPFAIGPIMQKFLTETTAAAKDLQLKKPMTIQEYCTFISENVVQKFTYFLAQNPQVHLAIIKNAEDNRAQAQINFNPLHRPPSEHTTQLLIQELRTAQLRGHQQALMVPVTPEIYDAIVVDEFAKNLKPIIVELYKRIHQPTSRKRRKT